MTSAYTPQQERAEDTRALPEHAHYDLVRCVGDGEEVGLGYWVVDRDWGALGAGARIASVEYSMTGIAFTPCDWQASPPDMDDDDDIASTRWADADGHEAIMMDGLPVKLV